MIFFFFFSSRRRHTRLQGDWSSDVCSSDLVVTRLKWIDPVCALCAGGENPPLTTTDVQIGGTASVNASTSAEGSVPAGAYCSGVTPLTAVGSSGSVRANGTPN